MRRSHMPDSIVDPGNRAERMTTASVVLPRPAPLPRGLDGEVDLDAPLQSLLATALDTAGCDLGVILMIDPAEGVLVGTCGKGLDPAQVEAIRIPLSGVQALAVDAALTARPTGTEDVAEDYRVAAPLRSILIEAGVSCMLAIPILNT